MPFFWDMRVSNMFESFSSKILMTEGASALPHTLHDPHARESLPRYAHRVSLYYI